MYTIYDPSNINPNDIIFGPLHFDNRTKYNMSLIKLK